MKAKAVLISDTHYSLNTLPLADRAWRMAVDKAAELGVPLIDCGDLTNDKAILRAEVVNALLATMQYARLKGVEVALLVGNHSLVNEKGKEHALNFLAPHALIIDTPLQWQGMHFIPYQAKTEDFEAALANVPPGATLIMHQGVTGSDMGEYVLDHSAISKDILADYRTISGHYHKAQHIKCGRPRKGAVGLMSYVGSPYTITFAEAKDGPKGFQVLHEDGNLEQVRTNLRRHIVAERTVETFSDPLMGYSPGDLVWLKVTGPTLELEKLSRGKIAKACGIAPGFKLDKIPTDSAQVDEAQVESRTNEELMDLLVDSSPETPDNKVTLKSLWRKVIS